MNMPVPLAIVPTPAGKVDKVGKAWCNLLSAWQKSFLATHCVHGQFSQFHYWWPQPLLAAGQQEKQTTTPHALQLCELKYHGACVTLSLDA